MGISVLPIQGWDWVSSSHAATHFNPLKSDGPFVFFFLRKRRNVLLPLFPSSFEYLWYNFISSLEWQIKLLVLMRMQLFAVLAAADLLSFSLFPEL